MNNKLRLLVGVFSLIIIACATNPMTGKKTLNFVPNSQLFPMSFQQYDTFLKENKVVSGTQDAKNVELVGKRIAAAAERYLTANGQGAILKDYQWEYKLVEDKALNAWCMPGGKIVFYTGIMPVCKDLDGLAVVMGHEVAHALADHGAQRMSAGQIQQIAGMGVALATSGKSKETQAIWMTAYGIGSQYGAMLPFSRSHESEADVIGLKLMAIAGFNPEVAVPFWQRMGANSGGQSPPEFMSTHPSHDTRITNLTNAIPQAKAAAKQYGVVGR
ncbi:MAG: M48 family metallopeptidase [Flavobacteriales bacterium]|nr:M48 family metallopeptidase [Flavobacteriales bacterium]